MVSKVAPKGHSVIEEPKFIASEKMTTEQLTDPDYRLKQLVKQNGNQPAICSRCHHCRR